MENTKKQSRKTIKRIDRGTGKKDFVTMSHALEKLSSYTGADKEDIKFALKKGATLGTISYLYTQLEKGRRER